MSPSEKEGSTRREPHSTNETGIPWNETTLEEDKNATRKARAWKTRDLGGGKVEQRREEKKKKVARSRWYFKNHSWTDVKGCGTPSGSSLRNLAPRDTGGGTWKKKNPRERSQFDERTRTAAVAKDKREERERKGESR